MNALLKATGLVVAILAVLISVSCGNAPEGDPTEFTGTWIITPANTGTKTLGPTSMTLDYFGEAFNIDVWLGTCTVSTGDIAGIWSAGAASGFGQNSVSIVSNLKTNDGSSEDQIDFTITSGLGTTMSGSFAGESSGDFSGFSGTFTMVKQ